MKHINHLRTRLKVKDLRCFQERHVDPLIRQIDEAHLKKRSVSGAAPNEKLAASGRPRKRWASMLDYILGVFSRDPVLGNVFDVIIIPREDHE